MYNSCAGQKVVLLRRPYYKEEFKRILKSPVEQVGIMRHEITAKATLLLRYFACIRTGRSILTVLLVLYLAG